MLVDMGWRAERYRASLAWIGPEKTNQVGLAHLRIGNGESRVPDESAINEIPRNPFFQRKIREIRKVAVDEVVYDADEGDAQVEPNRRRTTDQAVEIVALQRLESRVFSSGDAARMAPVTRRSPVGSATHATGDVANPLGTERESS